jgi:hypothetical protein
MTWCLRLRFDLSKRVKLEFDKVEWIIVDDTSTRITMHLADGSKNVAEAKRLSLHGGSYDTESLAEVASQQWLNWLILAFSSINIGVDFGDRAPSGGFTHYALEVASSAAQTQALNDVHGLNPPVLGSSPSRPTLRSSRFSGDHVHVWV